MARADGKPRQRHFKGMEPPSIPAIDGLADDLVEARRAAKRAKEAEREVADLLYAQLRQHRLASYTTASGRKVTIESTSKVKVAAAAAGGE